VSRHLCLRADSIGTHRVHIRAEDLKADLAFLASDTLQGRATPSSGLDAAAEYIASEMRKAGLEPVGDDGYFQTATYRTVTNEEGLTLTLNVRVLRVCKTLLVSSILPRASM
jgi:hypothetical protein